VIRSGAAALAIFAASSAAQACHEGEAGGGLGAPCGPGADCRSGLVCASDGHCRLPCSAGQACADGHDCIGGACLPKLGDGGTPDAALPDAGACFVANSCAPGSWHPITASPLEGRSRFGFAWTNSELFIVGGRSSDWYFRDGARYDPSADHWSSLPLLPESLAVRYDTPLVFTGLEVALWAGGNPVSSSNDGARFEIAAGSWQLIEKSGAPNGRVNHALVHDAADGALIVWGGFPSSDGARYALATKQWTALPPAPLSNRENFAYAWDATRRWLYVLGGSGFANDGAVFEAAANTWRALPPVPVGFAGRRLFAGVIADDKFVVWGGHSAAGVLSDGLIYDPLSDAWTPTAPSPLGGRASQLAVTDGQRIFYFGGIGTSFLLSDGAIFDVPSNTWSTSTASPLAGREQLGGAWTPYGIVVWGGSDHDDGAIYVP
jgi:hypothetical protein